MPSTVRVRTSRPERPVVIRRRPPPNARPDRHRRQDENAARAPCPRGVSFGPPRLRPGRGSARRQRPTDFLVAGGDPERHAQPKGDRAARADERKQPDNRCRNERRTHTRDDRSERAARRVDISKLPGHEVLRLREPYDDRRRRQRKSKQCKHVYPLVTVLRQWSWRPYGPVSRPVSRPPNPHWRSSTCSLAYTACALPSLLAPADRKSSRFVKSTRLVSARMTCSCV